MAKAIKISDVVATNEALASAEGVDLHQGLIKFEVKYPKDFKGIKHMSEGIQHVSKETADQVIEMKIGKIVD